MTLKVPARQPKRGMPMFAGLPGGSPGPNASSGCLGMIPVAIIALLVTAAVVAMCFYATSLIE